MPPEGFAVNVTALPTSPEDGPAMLTIKAEDTTITDRVTVRVLAVGVVESLTIKLTG